MLAGAGACAVAFHMEQSIIASVLLLLRRVSSLHKRAGVDLRAAALHPPTPSGHTT